MRWYKFQDETTKRAIKAALTLSCASSFLLVSYEIIRSSANALFNSTYGVQNLPIVTAISPFFILSFLLLNGKLLTRLGPRRVLEITTLGSALILGFCYALIALGFKPAIAILFVVRDTYAVVLVEQFWSFIDSTIDQKTAKKLNGLILALSSTGGLLGGVVLHGLVSYWGTKQMLLVGAFFLLPCWYLGQLAYRISAYDGEPRRKKIFLEKEDVMGLKAFGTHPILVIVFGVVLFSQFFEFFVSMNFQEMLNKEIPDLDQQTSFSALFFTATNASSFFMQLIVAPLVLSFVSATTIQLLIPLLTLVCVGCALIFPSIWSAGLAFLLFKSLDYSLLRASKEILYIPLPYDARFRTKGIIDVFGYRFGKGFASLGTTLFKRWGFQNINFLILSCCVAMGWLLFVSPLYFSKKATTLHVPKVPLG